MAAARKAYSFIGSEHLKDSRRILAECAGFWQGLAVALTGICANYPKHVANSQESSSPNNRGRNRCQNMHMQMWNYAIIVHRITTGTWGRSATASAAVMKYSKYRPEEGL
jgi:hypothetical protein